MFEVRTDLAVEENERITKAQEEAKGITVTEEDFEETMKKCIHISLADYKKLKLATRIEGKVLRLIAPLM